MCGIKLSNDDVIVLQRAYVRIQSMLTCASKNGDTRVVGMFVDEERLLENLIVQSTKQSNQRQRSISMLNETLKNEEKNKVMAIVFYGKKHITEMAKINEMNIARKTFISNLDSIHQFAISYNSGMVPDLFEAMDRAGNLTADEMVGVLTGFLEQIKEVSTGGVEARINNLERMVG